ncbi:methyltransferase domain-containing protein [Altererythrobacter salegens]|uniref:Methyltransferase domain-containing protein n=1 Tax=Croceibacterium salegens TaxID=1737568 RepID=A0A6I4SXI7_9SPHN|nr:methyltransferase domain-containing protein [Croceibacterium salegens]MXO60735.1 methyltransferase domain-containing protein [Croceibacterium salegens]
MSSLRYLLSPATRARIGAFRRKYDLHWPRRGSVSFGDLRCVSPISKSFGLDRGQAIDRYYIEAFLAANSARIAGRVLELGDPCYTQKFGGDRVTQSDVLHVVAGNPAATIIADLGDAPHIPDDSFDCIIFTQTLQMIYDMGATLRTLNRITKPGGSVLITTAGIAKVGRRLGRDDWGEYWRHTAQGLEAQVKEFFPGADADVVNYGNVLSACAFLQGLASDELEPFELDYVDEDFEVIIAARVIPR